MKQAGIKVEVVEVDSKAAVNKVLSLGVNEEPLQASGGRICCCSVFYL